MRIFFGGAEKATYRRMLLGAGVSRVAVNLTHLSIPKRKSLDLPTLFPECELVVYCSPDDEDVDRFDSFVREHADDITLVLGRPDYKGDTLTNYAPVWNDPEDMERLAWLCQRSEYVTVPDRVVEDVKIQRRLKALQQRWGTRLVVITGKPTIIDSVPWEAAIVGAWSSAVRYGETQVWDGTTLRRYPAQSKESSRKKHKADILRLGVPFSDLMEDDAGAAALLAIRSWQQYEDRGYGGTRKGVAAAAEPDDDMEVVDTGSEEVPPTSMALTPVGVDTAPANMRHERPQVLLPIMAVEDIAVIDASDTGEQGEYETVGAERQSVLRYRTDSQRLCSSCYLAAQCPGFVENANCAYNIPVQIRTKDQLNAALRAMIEMQVGRVMFARFAEELEGSGIDAALSGEIDRLFAMVAKFSDLSDQRDFVKLEVEAKGSAGVISRLFGVRAGEQVRQLPGGGLGPAATDALMGHVLDVDG